MSNLTNRPDKVAALDNSALSNFAKALKVFCVDSISVIKDAKITGVNKSADAIIDYKDFIIAVIKIAEKDEQVSSAKHEVTNILNKTRYPLGIVITESGIYHSRSYTRKSWRKYKFDKLAEEIRAVFDSIVTAPDKTLVKVNLISVFQKSQDFKEKSSVEPIFKKACEKLQLDHGKISFEKEDEIELMLTLLGGPLGKETEVCRYTTLDTLFKMLDGKTHAICCPISMNDNTEGSYADSFMHWHFKEVKNIQEIENDNSYFLLSCTDIKEFDSLTMWRLYAEDAKGVCIKYSVDASKVDNKKYFFARVSYGEKGDDSKPDHHELKFIYDLQTSDIVPGWYFHFSMWYIWKYFFKSWTYKDEKEIRLIYMPDLSNKDEKDRIKWYKDYNYGIFNRMALISIEEGKAKDFPLTINKIMLAPQSPNAYKNREQIQFMTKEKNIRIVNGFSVDISSIKNYR